LRDSLYQRIDHPMKRIELYKITAPIVASLKNGHTYMSPPRTEFGEYISKGGRKLPIVLQWNGNSVILKSYISPVDMPIGGEVLTIDNQDAEVFLKHIARYFPSENKNYNLEYLELHNAFAMFLWLDRGQAESLTLRIRNHEGTVEKYNIKSLSKKEIESEVSNNKHKYQAMSSSKGKNAGNTYRFIPESNAGLIVFNSFGELKEFRKFLKETFKQIKRQNVRNLIIDIRNNPGGNSQLGDEFLKYLTNKPFLQYEKMDTKISAQFREQHSWAKRHYPRKKIGSIESLKGKLIKPRKNPLRFSGQIFILVGRKTASSAANFAQAVKHFEIGTLVGQETIDTPVNYGDCVPATMPNSGLKINIACKRFVCAGGKPDGRGVIPDYEVKQKPEDTAKGIDTVLQFTLDLIKRSSNKANSTPDK